ncbi:MAG: hypothetical protein J7485_14010, partial [Sphingobium sp.]|nr:hypothetical protein [Sphingobium sp.]
PEPCTYSGGTYTSTGDPTATTATTTAQVRIGFVPYGVNVNVGRILPNNVMANSWVYQSREALHTTKYGYTLDNETAITGWSNWSGTTPTSSSLSDQSTYSGWSDISNSPTTMVINGVTVTKRPSTTQANCPTLNTIGSGSNKMLAYTDSGNVTSTLQSTTNNPPTYVSPGNPAQQTLTYTGTDAHSVSGYKYVWNTSGSGSCRLQLGTRGYNLTRTGGTSTKAIIWTQYDDVFTGSWSYRPIKHDVHSLKAGGSSWNSTITLPYLKTATGPTVTLSGQGSPTTLTLATSATIPWDGCIEEAQTYQNTGADPTTEWGTLNANAYDVNVNLIPDGTSTNPDWSSSVASRDPWLNSATDFGPGTFWGPMLANAGSNPAPSATTVYGAVWVRVDGSGNWTRNASSATSSYGGQNNGNNTTDFKYVCTTSAARKLAEYRTNTDFLAYVNGLAANDVGTYHDIGMLWGGRLISPQGIFASENAAASTGGAIQRHLIFMTDGGTNTVYNNYNAYGLSFYNRYQFSADVSSTSGETSTDNVLNARLLKICSQIKNMNIQLWVVSYGASVNTTTQTRLQTCATDANHFFNAADTPTLISNFQAIAAKISALRLTG